jgi:hypothetical protein
MYFDMISPAIIASDRNGKLKRQLKKSLGFTIAPYSMVDLTKEMYAVFLQSLGQYLRFLLRKLSVELALDRGELSNLNDLTTTSIRTL